MGSEDKRSIDGNGKKTPEIGRRDLSTIIAYHLKKTNQIDCWHQFYEIDFTVICLHLQIELIT